LQVRYMHRTTQTQNKRKQTSMPLVGLEPTISVFERAKIVHALDSRGTRLCDRIVTSSIRGSEFAICVEVTHYEVKMKGLFMTEANIRVPL
jgi:hypothetical protein